MKAYLSISNFKNAVILGFTVAFMSVPRIMQAGDGVMYLVPAAFILMVLTAETAVAWGKCAGMKGLFPERSRMLAGAMAGFMLACVLVLVYVIWLDPVFRRALELSSKSDFIEMKYPSTLSGCLAIALWSAGFETLFFQAAGMSYFARLTERQWIAVLVVVLLKVMVVAKQLSAAGVTEATALFLVSAAVVSLIGCMLFARTGIVGSAVFSGCLQLHLFFS